MMYFEDMKKTLEQVAENNARITIDTINTGLDKLHNSFPEVFSAEQMQEWKDNIDKLSNVNRNTYELLNDYFRLCQYTLSKTIGMEVDAVVKPDKVDRRFFDESWNENIVFDHIKQFYLLISQYVLKSMAENEHLDNKVNQQIDFYTKQWLDAMSPANFALTNPTVIKETLDTRGENLMNGTKAMLEDVIRGKGKSLMTRMTDYSAFEVGKNVATTPGKVIFQNELFQLIQYKPTTKTVFETPLLIVPPWINKYYILDLRKENSYIQWAVDQGHSVFVMSWVNPDETYVDTEFEDYLTQGVLVALDKTMEETDQRSVNAVGYCLGGSLLAITNAYLASKGNNPIKTSTYFTTMLDFEEPGDLGVFIDEQQLDNLDKQMEKDGYLDGSSMATVFNMLRANDLIWPFFINNYLLGKEPQAFDLLYWNSDSTRMPYKMHSFYLRNFYLRNRVRESGGIKLDGTPIDLKKIKNPSYFASTREDHIAPWKSTYAGAKLFSGPLRFILGGSGHIAGIINPPDKNKYNYWTNDTLEESPDNWLENAENNDGSWWPDWQRWVKKHAGKKVPARKPGTKLKPIEDAPGSYVKVRTVPE